MSKKITSAQKSTFKTHCRALGETVWERHLCSDTTGSMNSIDTSLRWHVCPCSLYCTGSLRVHPVIKRSCSVECGVFSEFVRVRELIAFATPPQMTPVINLGHTATDGHRTSAAESLNTCPSWPLE